MSASYIRHIWVYSILITRSGDIEKNLGPKPSSSYKFLICYWNLHSISVHCCMNISSAFLYFNHNFNIPCLSEAYLDSSNSSIDSNLTIPDYDLYRVDHLPNVKGGEFCMYLL